MTGDVVHCPVSTLLCFPRCWSRPPQNLPELGDDAFERREMLDTIGSQRAQHGTHMALKLRRLNHHFFMQWPVKPL